MALENSQAVKTVEQLQRVANNLKLWQKVEQLVETDGVDIFSRKSRRNLKRAALLLNPPGDSDGEESSEEEVEPPTKKPKGAKPPPSKHFADSTRGGKHAWSPILILKELQLAEVWQIQLELMDTQPGDYFIDRYELGTGDVSGLGGLASTSQATVLNTACNYVTQLEMRMGTDNVRWCFFVIFIYEIVLKVFPGYTLRLSAAALAQLGPLLQPLTANGEFLDDVDSLMSKINLWCRAAFKLLKLCRQHVLPGRPETEPAYGCILLLGTQLSPNFLTDKSTSVGGQWDDATEKLESLGMAQKAEDSGANRLGATIIEDLRRRLQAP